MIDQIFDTSSYTKGNTIRNNLLSPVGSKEDQANMTMAQEVELQDKLSNLVTFVSNKFNEAKEARRPIEERWLRNWKQFNGELSDDELRQLEAARQRNPTASALFIKITKTKSMAAYGQILEILFGDKTFPLAIEPTPEPYGIAEDAYLAPGNFPDEEPDAYGFEGDGRTIDPGATSNSILAGLKNQYQKFVDSGRKLLTGISPDPVSMPQLHPAEKSAQRMQKVIQDQLAEQDVEMAVRNLVLEQVILGTGCIKGPFTCKDTIHRWEKGASGLEYNPIEKITPKPSFTSVWNVYPDPSARRIWDASYLTERHRLTAHKLASLKDEPLFIVSAVDEVLTAPGKRIQEWWEPSLEDRQNRQITNDEYEAVEYWGYVTKEMLQGISEVDQETLEQAEHQVLVNIWTCGDKVIKLILNPLIPDKLRYYLVPYEEHPYQIWGTGLPENMKDSQAMINGSMRMTVDNLKFAGSVMFEVNENYLVPGQDMNIFNGKIFRTQGGAPGQSIHAITTPNVANSNMQLSDKARTFADESTGQPSYSYGQYTTGQTRTASGMDMLMQAASLSVKTVIKNIDQYLIEPMGQAYFYWNMQFNDDIEEIHGDLRVVAKGTTALVQKAVQSQRLLSFLQIGANQMVAPFINFEYVVKEVAKAMGIDPDKATNDKEMAALYAEIIGKMSNALNQGSGPQGQGAPGAGNQTGVQPATGGNNPSDPTGSGGGNIGTGGVPMPGQAGFAAST